MGLVVLSTKVDAEIRDLWKKTMEAAEVGTGNQFVELLLERFLNPKTVDKVPEGYVSPDEHAEQITQAVNYAVENVTIEKDNKIGRLKTAHTLEIEKKEDEINSLSTEVQELLHQQTAPVPTPSETQLLIEVNPFVLFAIDDEIAAEQKKNKIEFSRGALLLNSFLTMKKDGRVHACKIWSDREFNQQKIKHLKAAE